MLLKNIISLAALPWLAMGLADTDSIADADVMQSGYLPNHNMDPAIVGSSIFGMLWTNKYDKNEKWYGRPIVYTPKNKNTNGGNQLVFSASTQNWIRTVDGKTGVAVSSRQVMPPFLQSDIGCTDIPNYIGVVGSPVMDPDTDTVYFFAKGYQNGASNGGVAKGIYKFFAVDINTLQDKPGFPVLLDGHFADNDNGRYFNGGTVLQRTGLLKVGSYIYGGFGGHCDQYNYTGLIVGMGAYGSASSGKVAAMFATEISPVTPVTLDIMDEDGGKAGIWQSGMALSSDGNRLFFATGNGQGHENKETAQSGRYPLKTLDETVNNLAIDPSTGKLSLSDYFEPYEYIGMDAGDRDLGSGGVALLDSKTFKGSNVARIAVTVGKNGKAYIMNADDLGGFKNGAGGTDRIIQTISANGAVFGGSGSYPLEGGYLYFTPTGGQTVAYKMGLDSAGKPTFSYAGGTYRSYGNNPGVVTAAGRVGVGIPTITTLKGQAGTALLWVTDPDGGLRVFNAVPDNQQRLQQIAIPNSGGLNKFLRPAFGDGRLYISDNSGNIICFGSPVAIPLNCTSPIDFGNVNIGSTSTQNIKCTANIAINKVTGLTSNDPAWQVSNSSIPTGPLAVGQSFTFPVVWNLTTTKTGNAQNASFGATTPGVKSGVINVITDNANGGLVGGTQYVSSTVVSVTGTQVSSNPFLQVTPTELDFAGVVIGGVDQASGSDASFVINNVGAKQPTILGYGYTQDLDPPVVWKNVTGNKLGDDGFTSSSLPKVGTIIPAGGNIVVPVNFNTVTVGSYQNIFKVYSDGGDQTVLMVASASTTPKAVLTIETSEHGFNPGTVMDFGDVLAGTTVSRRIRICNTGGSSLEITKSKPPIQTELRATNPSSDLHEGQFIEPGDCAYGVVAIDALAEQVNSPDHTVSDFWTLNTADVTFGVHEIKITANIVTKQVGPKNTNGTAKYNYLGCYYDGLGRQLSKKLSTTATLANSTSTFLPNYNSVTNCTSACWAQGYIFAGTQYHTECWCGTAPPTAAKYTTPSDNKCTWSCSGDSSQACGGDGTYENIFYDSTRWSPQGKCDVIPCSSTTSSSSTMSSTSTSSTTSSATSVSTTSSLNSTSTSSSSLTSTSSIMTNSSTISITSSTSTSTSSSASPTYTGPPVTNQGNSQWKYLSCYKDPTNLKSLNPNVKYAADSMTVQVCLDYCKGKNANFAGLEYGRECYCGIAKDTLVSTTPNWTGCTILCKSNVTEYCGGSSAMNVYQFINTTSSSTTSSTTSVASTSSTTTTTSTILTNSSVSSTTTTSSVGTTLSTITITSTTTSSTSSGPTPTATKLGYISAGCFAEPSGTRAFQKLLVSNTTINIEVCLQVAKDQMKNPTPTTYGWVGLEYGKECWAATTPANAPTQYVGSLACPKPCAGDASEKCGGAGMFNLYITTASTSVSTTTSVATVTTGTMTASA